MATVALQELQHFRVHFLPARYQQVACDQRTLGT